MPKSQSRNAEVLACLRVIGRRTDEQRRRESDEVNLAEIDLRGLVLDNLNLRDTDLREAHLEGATLRNTRLSGAFLLGTHLEGALVASWDLTQEQVDNACGNAETVLSAHLEKPPGWIRNPPVCRSVEH